MDDLSSSGNVADQRFEHASFADERDRYLRHCAKRLASPSATEKRRHIAALLNYMTNPTAKGQQRDAERQAGRALGREKCVAWGADSFIWSSVGNVAQHITEMADLACMSARGDPIKHLVISWQPGDRPTVDQMKAAASSTVKELGLERHLWAWALHANRDSLHTHVAIIAVDPEVYKMTALGYRGLYKEALARSAARIRFDQNWEPEPGARYSFDGQDFTKQVSDIPPISQGAAKEELRTGVSSYQRLAQEAYAQLRLDDISTWAQLHLAMAAVGLRYERVGSGGVIHIADGAVKASNVSHSLSYPKLETSLGRFDPPHGSFGIPDARRLEEEARAAGPDLSGLVELRTGASDLLF